MFIEGNNLWAAKAKIPNTVISFPSDATVTKEAIAIIKKIIIPSVAYFGKVSRK